MRQSLKLNMIIDTLLLCDSSKKQSYCQTTLNEKVGKNIKHQIAMK